MTTKEQKLKELQQTIDTIQKQMEEILKQPDELLTIEDCYNKVKPLWYNRSTHRTHTDPSWDHDDNKKGNLPSEKHCLQIQAIQKMMVVAEALNEGWVVDWRTDRNAKYKINYDNENNKVNVDSNSFVCANYVYFKSEDVANQAIKILGEETIKQAYGL